jgi:hypothetical protein
MTDPRTPRTSDWHQGTHSDQCVSIGGGPGHHDCVCFCHHNLTEPGTEAGKALLSYGRAMYATKWAETDYTNLVLAIEAEASTLGSSERLAAALRAIVEADDAMLATQREVAEAWEPGDEQSDAWLEWARRYSEALALRSAAIQDARLTLAVESIVEVGPCRCEGCERKYGALSDPDAERQRAIGEAVERLPVGWSVVMWTSAGQREWQIEDGYDTVVGFGPDLPEAIAAALPAAQEPYEGVR